MYSYPCRSPITIAVHMSIHLYAHNISRTAEWINIKCILGIYKKLSKHFSLHLQGAYAYPSTNMKHNKPRIFLDFLLLCYFNVVWAG